MSDRIELSDPGVMRALAHPSRLSILELLRESAATATECSDAVGESPSACSYHLRALARWGLVEEVESSDGRERRWQAKISGFRASAVPEVSPSAAVAASFLLRQASLERDAQVLSAFFENEDRCEAAWHDAATFVSTSIRVTPAELEELRATVLKAIEEIHSREEPENPETRRVHLVIRAIPVEQP